EKRFFTSNLLRLGNWTPNCGATQNRGDVATITRKSEITTDTRLSLSTHLNTTFLEIKSIKIIKFETQQPAG
ncbi:hypothetical protein, partial [Xanthomonas phaseoli]